jgi:hypothetical protein
MELNAVGCRGLVCLGRPQCKKALLLCYLSSESLIVFGKIFVRITKERQLEVKVSFIFEACCTIC